MARKKVCGIYKITNKITNKVYIGQALDIANRWACHRKHVNKRKTALQCAMYKYGVENFKFEILQICSSIELNDLEIQYIKEYNSCILFENSNGYNMTTGGNGGYGRPPITLETRQKISNTLKGRKFPISEEGMKRRKEASSKIRHDEVICDGVEYDSVAAFARNIGLTESTVRCWLQGNLKMPGEWFDKRLRYKNKKTTAVRRQDNYRTWCSKPVIFDGKIYDSIVDCAKALNVHERTVKRWLYGKCKMPKHLRDKELKFYKEIENANK